MDTNVEASIKKSKFSTFLISQIVIIISLIFIIVFSFGVFYKNEKESSITVNQKVVTELNDHLKNFFLKANIILSSSAESIDFMLKNNADNQEILNYLTSISTNEDPDFFVSATGFYGYFRNDYLDGTGWIPDSDYIPQSRDWYKGADKANGKIALASPYIDAQTGKMIISLSKSLSDKKSVISVDIAMDDIQNFVRELIEKEHENLIVLNREGTVIAHTNISEIGKNYLYEDDTQESRIIKKIFFNPVEEQKFETIYNDKPVVVLSQKVLNEWYIIGITDKSTLVKETLKNLILIILGLLFVFIIMIYFCFSNFRSRIKISKYAQMLSKYKSDLEHQVVDQWNQLDKKTHDLVQMQESVIEGMATVIEYRDVNTGMHVQNTKRYVLMITKYLLENGLHSDEVNQNYVSMIGNAAAMHDIGKVAISDRILNKPAKLDDSEFEIMKQHTILGAGLVRQVFGNSIDEEMLRVCVDVVQYHHEKWNGKGYPFGLSGEDIPLSARIMAIADVFDAIASKRVYKDAVPVEEVFEIIKKDAGSHFDPELAEIFLGMKDQVIDYLEKNFIEPSSKL